MKMFTECKLIVQFIAGVTLNPAVGGLAPCWAEIFAIKSVLSLYHLILFFSLLHSTVMYEAQSCLAPINLTCFSDSFSALKLAYFSAQANSCTQNIG